MLLLRNFTFYTVCVNLSITNIRIIQIVQNITLLFITCIGKNIKRSGTLPYLLDEPAFKVSVYEVVKQVQAV